MRSLNALLLFTLGALGRAETSVSFQNKANHTWHLAVASDGFTAGCRHATAKTGSKILGFRRFQRGNTLTLKPGDCLTLAFPDPRPPCGSIRFGVFNWYNGKAFLLKLPCWEQLEARPTGSGPQDACAWCRQAPRQGTARHRKVGVGSWAGATYTFWVGDHERRAGILPYLRERVLEPIPEGEEAAVEPEGIREQAGPAATTQAGPRTPGRPARAAAQERAHFTAESRLVIRNTTRLEQALVIEWLEETVQARAKPIGTRAFVTTTLPQGENLVQMIPPQTKLTLTRRHDRAKAAPVLHLTLAQADEAPGAQRAAFLWGAPEPGAGAQITSGPGTEGPEDKGVNLSAFHLDPEGCAITIFPRSNGMALPVLP